MSRDRICREGIGSAGEKIENGHAVKEGQDVGHILWLRGNS
jgi:hypothetical protein